MIRKIDSFLAFSDRFFDLDTRYFFKGSFFAFIQQGLGLSIGLITSYLFGHFVSKTVFGEYNLALSIFSLLAFVSLPALDNPLTQSVARGYEGSFIKTIRARFLASLLGIPVVFAFSLYYYLINQYTIAITLSICSLLFPFFYSFQSYQAFFVAKKRFELVALFSTLSSLFFALFTGIAIFFAPVALPLVFAYLFSSIIPALFGIFIVKNMIVKSRVDPHLVPYGLFLTLTNTIAWVSANLGNIILAAFLGVEELAILTVASKYPLTIQKSYTVFSKTITAKIAGQSKKNHYNSVTKHWWKLLLIGIGMFVIIIIPLPFLLHFLFPVGYTQAPIYAFWISTTLIPLPLSWVLSDILLFQKRKKAQLFITGFHSIGKLLAYFIVIPIWKTPGMVALLVIEDYLFFFLYLGAFFYYKKSLHKST